MSEEENQSPEAAAAETPAAKAAPDGSANLEAIMHIPLEVSVELGRIEVPLHEVVRMGRGTVLKLHKEANAMVDILANGTVFARGEVVKADGKLGVRVTSVVAPTERIRALA